MRVLVVVLAVTSYSYCQDNQINTRLGLLNNNPLGTTNTNSGQSQAFTNSQPQNQASGRVPIGGNGFGQTCCCVSPGQSCSSFASQNSNNGFGGGTDLVGLGLIDPRINKTLFGGIGTRIVNNPSSKPSPINSCPTSYTTCCFDNNNIDTSSFQRSCLTPEAATQQSNGAWRQGCAERVTSGGNKLCGTRNFRPVSTSVPSQSSPGEFPWTCLLLNQDNDFIGTCVIVPEDFSNNNGRATRKVLTAAHKLKKLGQNDLLKVRVGEWDASGFNNPEQFQHDEYTVVKITQHPQFSEKRLSNNMAILKVDRNIDLNKNHVNTACLPSCDEQFNFRFNNGTGTRCWVAGWGKDSQNGQFQFIQRKVDLPLYESSKCENSLKIAMNNRNPGLGDRFQLSDSEICAGGVKGKDACTGDGGSPLVCQAQSGRWTVVGLVTWGVGCASEVPGVYAKVSYFKDWINRN